MEGDQSTTNSESNKDKSRTIGKAALISILSPILAFTTAGIGGAVVGYLGARDFEINNNKRLGFGPKLGYTLISAFALGIINPYTFDIVEK
jgi:hypothetical protein